MPGDTAVKTTLEWMELTYDAEFSVPPFDLPRRGTDLLQSLYQFIHPRFPIRTTDMHVFGGTTLSDVCVRVTLFGGNGTIDVNADRLSTRFIGLRQHQDLDICNQCIALAEKAFKSILPDVEIGLVSIRPILALRLGDESTDAREHLKAVVKPAVHMDLSGLGAAALHPCVNLEVQNDDERWRAVLHAYPSEVDRHSIVVACSIVHTESPDSQSSEERNDRLWRLIAGLLRGLGLETPTPAITVTS